MIEGAVLTVCQQCSGLGNVIGKVSPPQRPSKKTNEQVAKDIEITIIAGDYPSRIRKAREQLHLSQHDLAQKINEKESLLAHLENGTIRPSMSLTRKLEQLLSIRLIEKTHAVAIPSPASKEQAGNNLTLGDVIIVRKRKR